MRHRKIAWKLCQLGVLCISIITFTPLTIPKNSHLPELFGLPYTLWVGMLLSLGFISLIFIGIRVHPGAAEKEDEI